MLTVNMNSGQPPDIDLWFEGYQHKTEPWFIILLLKQVHVSVWKWYQFQGGFSTQITKHSLSFTVHMLNTLSAFYASMWKIFLKYVNSISRATRLSQ